MPKGLFTQTVCLLLRRPVTLDQIEAALGSETKLARIDACEHWAFGQESLMLEFDAEKQGRILFDLLEHPWPDGMGDPEKEPMIFGAWSLGNFGPATYPQGLQRAAQHCYFWEEAGEEVAKHNAVLRVRVTYATGTTPDAPMLPDGYSPLEELNSLMSCVSAIAKLDEVICYFNPSGEVLRPVEQMAKILEQATTHGIPPLELWTNVRMYGLNSEWSMMDTVGNMQVDVPDVEAVFRSQQYDPNKVAGFLGQVTLYLMQTDKEVSTDDTLDGPGKVQWKFEQRDQALAEPPRKIIRITPEDGHATPEIQRN
ncbi:MAG: hypothetical protein COA78_10705 [Blastopirellula sp.]|nr:MAG: hypothetical protein COA78_10705 [Blastopirellula sp.]